MSVEDESWRSYFSDSDEGKGRDGYAPQGRDQGRDGDENRARRRPRIQRQPYGGADSRGDRRTYDRWEGRDMYPRCESGYQSRDGYFQRREGGYQRRDESYNRSAGSYQPRGGYQSRDGYRPREGSYYQRRRDDSYQLRDGSFQRREGGYQQREGSFRQQGSRSGYQWQHPRSPFRPRTADHGQNARYDNKKRIDYKETDLDPNAPIRLNRFLSNAGVCSRRDADGFIEAGVVSVNGTVVTELGTKVLRSDDVRFHDQPVKMEKKMYVLLNKPKNCVTTSDDPQNRKTVMELVKDVCRERIYPVGRLDRNTTGVLLLTNDGELASKLTHPQFKKKKIYHVFTDKNVTAADMRQMVNGIPLEDGEVRADAVEYASETDKKQVGIEIHSGRNRIVRRIFEHLGYKVIKLDRVYFAGLTKKGVKRGDWRYLTEREVSMLRMGAFE